MNNLLSDVKTSAKVFGEIRKARKSGADGVRVNAQPVKRLSIINSGAGLYDTIEGCVLSRCDRGITKAANEVFNALPVEERNRLAKDIENGEFIERADYWRELLKPVLSPKQLRDAMIQIIHWYIHIKRDLRTIRKPKSIDYPLYPDMQENSVMSRHNPMHRALIDKLDDDLNVIWTYYKVVGSKIALDFLHSDTQGHLVNLKLWFDMSDEDSAYYNSLVTYGKYVRVREEIDACLQKLEMGA